MNVVEMLPRCLQMALDDEYCDEALERLTAAGVEVLTNERVVYPIVNTACKAIIPIRGID